MRTRRGAVGQDIGMRLQKPQRAHQGIGRQTGEVEEPVERGSARALFSAFPAGNGVDPGRIWRANSAWVQPCCRRYRERGESSCRAVGSMLGASSVEVAGAL